MSNLKKRIAIFDHVGEKAGMDYYDTSLLKGFLNAGHEGYVFSNFPGSDSGNIHYSTVYRFSGKGATLTLWNIQGSQAGKERKNRFSNPSLFLGQC